ncbi:MAG: VOC family protein [Actinomycetia bacterium]|nr:VOC family protein [Actinomycetes bacterium]MCP4222736.1 VOC family protein [Actinomycetes bacterium]MCP5034053.1 VOC family protein [Actinomycetes bacterium]
MSEPIARIDYIELPAPELEPTKAFYAKAFGWDWTDFGPTYAVSQTTSPEIGLNALGEPGPPGEKGAENPIGPLVLMCTDRLDEALAVVRDAGGRITSEPYAYPGGRRFHVADPSGNVIGIYQPDQD